MIFEETTTIFYEKETNKVFTFCSGIQNMNFLGENIEENTKKYSLIHVNNSDFDMNKMSAYKVINEELIYDETLLDLEKEKRLTLEQELIDEAKALSEKEQQKEEEINDLKQELTTLKESLEERGLL